MLCGRSGELGKLSGTKIIEVVAKGEKKYFRRIELMKGVIIRLLK